MCSSEKQLGLRRCPDSSAGVSSVDRCGTSAYLDLWMIWSYAVSDEPERCWQLLVHVYLSVWNLTHRLLRRVEARWASAVRDHGRSLCHEDSVADMSGSLASAGAAASKQSAHEAYRKGRRIAISLADHGVAGHVLVQDGPAAQKCRRCRESSALYMDPGEPDGGTWLKLSENKPVDYLLPRGMPTILSSFDRIGVAVRPHPGLRSDFHIHIRLSFPRLLLPINGSLSDTHSQKSGEICREPSTSK